MNSNNEYLISKYKILFKDNLDLLKSIDFNDEKTINNLNELLLFNNSINYFVDCHLPIMEMRYIINPDLYKKSLLIKLVLDNKIDKETIITILLKEKINSKDFSNYIRYILKNIKKYNLSNGELNFIHEVFISDNNNLIELITYLVDNINLYNNIKNKIKMESIDKLSRLVNVKYDELTVLDGQKFNLLVHRLTGYTSPDIQSKLINNLSNWYSCSTNVSILSTSLISNKFMGMIYSENNASVLGFRIYDPRYVLDMGSDDLYSSSSQYQDVLNKSRFMMPEDLLSTHSGYNEIVLKRMIDNKVIEPSYILSLDKVTSRDKKIASYFDKPIVLLKRNIYLNEMSDSIAYLLRHDNLEQLSDKIMNMFLSCSLDRKLIKTYFNSKSNNQSMNEIINQSKILIDSNNKDQIKRILYEIISTYDTINNTKCLAGIKSNFDVDIFSNKVKRL